MTERSPLEEQNYQRQKKQLEDEAAAADAAEAQRLKDEAAAAKQAAAAKIKADQAAAAQRAADQRRRGKK